RAIQLARLLLVERVDVRVAAVGEDSALHEVRLDTGRGIAECARSRLDDVLVLLFAEFLDESGALDRAQPTADADGEKIVDDAFGDVGIRGVAIVVAGVEAAAQARLGE